MVTLRVTTTGQEQQQGVQPKIPPRLGVSGGEVFHSSPQLPVLEVVKHPIQHGLRLREQFCEGFEQGDAHNVEEPKLQLQTAAEAEVETIWCMCIAVVCSVCVVGSFWMGKPCMDAGPSIAGYSQMSITMYTCLYQIRP